MYFGLPIFIFGFDLDYVYYYTYIIVLRFGITCICTFITYVPIEVPFCILICWNHVYDHFIFLYMCYYYAGTYVYL